VKGVGPVFLTKKAFSAADNGLESLDGGTGGVVKRLMAAREWASAGLGA
jgi:hypothetical protein